MNTTVNVAAVVVTYNRVRQLHAALESIVAQSATPSSVIVVNNASTDGTREWLEGFARARPALRVFHLDQNVGGAGGFHFGVREAVSAGAEYVWVMDDDCRPRGDALALLIDAFHEYEQRWGISPGFTSSRILWADGAAVCEMNIPAAAWNWNHPYTERLHAVAVHWCSFVSCLFKAEDVRRVGLPLKEYFIWYDDLEFTRRLAWGKCGLVVLDSVAIHDMPANEPVDWARVNPANLWKYRYGIRNEASWRLHHEGRRSYRDFLRFVWQRMAAGRVPLKLRMAMMKAGLSAIRFNPVPDKV